MSLQTEHNHPYYDEDSVLHEENGNAASLFDDDYEALKREADYYDNPLSDDYIREEYR